MQLKCVVLPFAGAVLGGAVGGPVGIVAGLKAAKLAAFSGGILGMLSHVTYSFTVDFESLGPVVKDMILQETIFDLHLLICLQYAFSALMLLVRQQ